MSATKSMAKWVKTADLDALRVKREQIRDFRGTVKNPLVRASLGDQLDIVEAELRRRSYAESTGV